MAKLTAAARKKIPAGKFAGPGRSFPIEDKAHIRAAESYERYASPSTKAKINAAANKAFGKKAGRGR
jgi:hypothetical protein